jgi:hypothetical protein
MNARSSEPNVGLGLLIAGFPASFLSVLLMFGSMYLFGRLSPFALQDTPAFLGWMLVYSLIGLPIAWLIIFAIGLPLWIFVAKECRVTHAYAARLGAIGGAIIGGVETLIGLLTDGIRAINQGGVDVVTKHAFDVACTIGICVICAVVANHFAGPLKPQPPSAT